PHPRSPCFPYTTLFRSDLLTVACVQLPELSRRVVTDEPGAVGRAFEGVVVDDDEPPVRRQVDVTFDEVAADGHRRAERPHGVLRSEEHTSELQSLAYLV